MMLKVVVAGSRSLRAYWLLEEKLDYYLSQSIPNVEIVSGTADGADQLGEIYGLARNLPIKQFPADWNTHGKSGGVIRNKEMLDYADVVVVFWDGESRGTKNMIDITNQWGKPLRVVMFDKVTQELR